MSENEDTERDSMPIPERDTQHTEPDENAPQDPDDIVNNWSPDQAGANRSAPSPPRKPNSAD